MAPNSVTKVSVLSTVDTAHEDMIHDAQMDYYGTRLATCSSDRSVRIFDVRNGQQTFTAELKGHEGPVWQVCWGHPMFGNLLATCSYDRKVIIWKETNGTWNNIYEYTNHDSSVTGLGKARRSITRTRLDVTLSPGAHPSNQELFWINLEIRKSYVVWCRAVVIIWSRFGRRMMVSGWRSRNWRRITTGSGTSPGPLPSDCPDPSSQVAQDCQVIIWSNDGTSSTWNPKVLHKFNDVVWSVSWSVTGNILAVSGGDNKVSLWKETLEGDWVCVSNVNKGQGYSKDAHDPNS
ncbi:hypothetical protein CAPTEDRAFT_192936 [Capitella teleta]|uniref:Protein SEC13 homolog n=1 Tax=Capitella teleta TaxID=283909 RepID=R7V6C7_CAPTE|nr:hypothetical protein CAPTEDRAFT_192936 [Capitella teleta]|eukprot:ELU11906.1 hypothetical protein CAPTEDRAFT_192936 [Capitella teleta]